ncbi:MAG: histidine kinase [Candidatus Omnitrophota bacterium]
MRRFVWFSLLVVGIFLSVGPSVSIASTREEALSRYEKLMSFLERSDLRADASGGVAERMDSIHEALTRADYDAAGRQIDSLTGELENDHDPQKKDLDKEARLYWFEFLLDVFQKLAVLGLLAFLLIQNSSWRAALKRNKVPNSTRFVWGVLAVFVSVVFRVLDLSRYGDSVWSIFDMQVVLAAIAGLLMGPFWGILSGLLMALLRLLSKPGILDGPAVVLGAAAISSFFSWGTNPYIRSGKRGFVCGALVGLAHGCTVYLPLAGMLSPGNIIFSIVLVTFLEGLGVAVFFSVISVVLQSELKKDMEHELLRTQLLFLQAQLNPHFLFNALNTIASVCGKAGASTAESLVVKLAGFLRHILSRREDHVTLREELTFIDTYLDLEKARFGDKLKIHRDLTLNDAAWAVKIPLLILQPLVENAIKHGLRPKQGDGTVTISGRVEGDEVEIAITDDGVGKGAEFFSDLLAGRTDKVDGTGIGLRNIEARLRKLYSKKQGLSFSGGPGQGTCVKVRFPLQPRRNS